MLRAACLFVLACCLCACQSEPDGLWVASQAHMNEPAPGQTRAAVYLKLENLSAEDRRIQFLSTPVAGTAEVHRHTYEDGVMKMRPVAHAQIPARSALVFEPGGYHIMLIDLAEVPAVGSRFPITFEFDTGVPLVVEVEVRGR
jgi:copper(I)-binding protein